MEKYRIFEFDRCDRKDSQVGAPGKTRLLMVSYLFPPVGGVGVQRALSLAKYLPKSGFEVHVLKAWNAAAPLRDPELLKEVPPEVHVHRAFTPELPFYVRKKLWRFFSRPSTKNTGKGPGVPTGLIARCAQFVTGSVRRLLSPEPEVLWVPFAIRKARRLVKKHGIDTVLVTAPPFSAFLVGNALKRQFPHLKYVADVRDDWLRYVLNDLGFQNSPQIKRRAAEIERATATLADLVVFATRSFMRGYQDRYPDQPASKFAYLPNGYDAASFSEAPPRTRSGQKIVVTYVGSVYRATSPRGYLKALDGAPDELRSQFETRFIGRISDEEMDLLRGHKGSVQFLGFLPHKEALLKMLDSAYLLLTVNNDFAIPGKMFEYLATGIPILATAPAGSEVATLMQETVSGWCVEP